ncbi:MAG TPA: hypothetical protein VFH30_12600 [Acidimicrobiales bacterium]|nr:hypothetical protein [Acidimicrobiales bacterium]
MTRRPTGATAAVVATVALVALVRADPAAADPPVPTDYRSRVDAIEPAADGVGAEVVGGDAFLELTVDRSHEVVVTGYQGEPYLRFRPDGTVQRNRRSPATYVNDSRDAVAQVPASADPEADPDWETVADGGAYAWHDHRIHWMGSERPDGAEPGEWTKPWTVDIEVDGTPTRINGTLALVDGVNPLPWLALGLAAAAAVVIAGRRRPLVVASVAALVAAGLATGVGWAQRAEAPAGSGASPLLVAVPLAGAAAAGLGITVGRRLGRRVLAATTLAAAAAAAGWGVLRLDVLSKPVLPTVLDAGLDRAGTTVALVLALAAAGLVVWGSGLVLTDDHDNEPKTGAAATVAGGDRR